MIRNATEAAAHLAVWQSHLSWELWQIQSVLSQSAGPQTPPPADPDTVMPGLHPVGLDDALSFVDNHGTRALRAQAKRCRKLYEAWTSAMDKAEVMRWMAPAAPQTVH